MPGITHSTRDGRIPKRAWRVFGCRRARRFHRLAGTPSELTAPNSSAADLNYGPRLRRDLRALASGPGITFPDDSGLGSV